MNESAERSAKAPDVADRRTLRGRLPRLGKLLVLAVPSLALLLAVRHRASPSPCAASAPAADARATSADAKPVSTASLAGSASSPSVASPSSASVPTLPALDTIVVAIHGIGNQRHSETVRSVARRFGARMDPPLPVLPLGFFHIPDTADVRFSRLDVGAAAAPEAEAKALARIGFAEVFWADIPRGVVQTEDTLEESKAWAATIVSRAQRTYRTNVHPDATGARTLKPADFDLATGAIEEAIETVAVLENLLTVTKLADRKSVV